MVCPCNQTTTTGTPVVITPTNGTCLPLGNYHVAIMCTACTRLIHVQVPRVLTFLLISLFPRQQERLRSIFLEPNRILVQGGDNMGCGCRGNKNKRMENKKRRVREVLQKSQQVSTDGLGSTLSGITPNEQAQAAPRTPNPTPEDRSKSS
jgi:hypothetical protein